MDKWILLGIGLVKILVLMVDRSAKVLRSLASIGLGASWVWQAVQLVLDQRVKGWQVPECTLDVEQE